MEGLQLRKNLHYNHLCHVTLILVLRSGKKVKNPKMLQNKDTIVTLIFAEFVTALYVYYSK